MNIADLDKTKPQTEPNPGSVMVVSYKRLEVSPTDWIAGLESEMLARAATVTQVTNAGEQDAACAAQAGLARYVRKVLEAEEKAKAPLNQLRKKILELSKQLIAKADEEGNRLGALVAEFQTMETKRLGALRRLQDEQASQIERDRDKKIALATSTAQIEAIQEESRQQIADNATPLEPVRAEGQVIREDWTVTVTDIHKLYRNHPNCVTLTPLVGEIKALLNEGTIPKGVTAVKVMKAGVRLNKESPAIEI